MANEDDEPSAHENQSTATRIAEDLSRFAELTGDFYRGEIDRTTAWRARLDQTTNWAVVVVAAILTWAFSTPDRPHYVILIGVFAVTAFLLMEANRYREYDVWRRRVRTLQNGLFAEMYASDSSGNARWQEQLSGELRDPAFALSFREALTHRLRRSYLALLLILLAAWVARIALLEPNEPWRRTSAILGIPGEIVTLVVGFFYFVLIILTVWSARGPRVQEFQE